jgi:hypothetical protein
MEINKPVRMYFNEFWPGFLELTNPNTVLFFIELFKLVFKSEILVERNSNDADILCEHVSTIHNTLIYKKKWKYTILVSGESIINVNGGKIPEHYNDFSCFLSGLNPNVQRNGVKFPLFISYLFCNNTRSMSPVTIVPTQTVCAVISNPKGVVRNKFLEQLEKYVPVFYGGSFKNNIGYTVGGDHNSHELIHFIKQHKFVITMENSEEDYYITEKICNGLFAGTIPVYWGSPNVNKYINSNRFLQLNNDSYDEIYRIINTMITMDDTTYLNMVNADILINTNMIDTLVNDITTVLC